MFDAAHRCQDCECPSFGQRTFSQCGCHKTVETMLREEVARLETALKTTMQRNPSVVEAFGNCELCAQTLEGIHLQKWSIMSIEREGYMISPEMRDELIVYLRAGDAAWNAAIDAALAVGEEMWLHNYQQVFITIAKLKKTAQPSTAVAVNDRSGEAP